MIRTFSSFYHFFLPAKCDFCPQFLKDGDFNRLCLKCIGKAIHHDRKIASAICHICYHPLFDLAQLPIGGDFSSKEKILCLSCQNKSFAFSKHKSCFYNDLQIKDFFYNYKFNKNISYSDFFTKMILRRDKDFFHKSDYLLPITLLTKDILKREFCPVLTIVKPISKILNIPYKLCIKRNKKKYKKSQHSQSKVERENQISDKYLYLKRYRNYFDNKTVVLFDDVFTTGSTLEYVARIITAHNTNVTILAYSLVRSYLK